MESIFDVDYKSYIFSSHAQKRLFERGDQDLKVASHRGKKLIRSGKLLLETKVFRYVRNGDLFFPCKIVGKNVYLVTTVLNYDEMVKDRFQNIVDRYDKQ